MGICLFRLYRSVLNYLNYIYFDNFGDIDKTRSINSNGVQSTSACILVVNRLRIVKIR